jgi:protein disulfide-isomerase A1
MAHGAPLPLSLSHVVLRLCSRVVYDLISSAVHITHITWPLHTCLSAARHIRMRAVALSWALLLTVAVAEDALISIASTEAFDKLRKEHVGFPVLVYAPWCGHSRALLPAVEAAAAKLKASHGIPFVKIDGTEADELATRLDVKGYPSLLFIRRGNGPPIEFEGARNAAEISKWAVSGLESDVTKLATPASVAEWTARKPAALVLFVADYNAPEVEAFYGVAASKGSPPCAVTVADPSATALKLETLGQTTPPALVAFSNSGHAPLSLRPTKEEPLTHALMLKWGRAAVLPPVLTYTAQSEVEGQLFGSDVPLQLLFFHSTALDAALTAELAAAGATLRGETIIATIETTAYPEVASFFDVHPQGALPAPALLAFSLANGTKYLHSGAFTRAAIANFARAAANGQLQPHLRSQPRPEPSGGPLVELVGSSFAEVAFDTSKDVLVQLYSPSCGHCKKLYPVYNAVAEHFAKAEPDVVVAQIDAIANDVPGIDPEGFPTILLYTKSNKRGFIYDGSRDAHDFIQFVKDAREGKNSIGGLQGDDESPDEDDGYRVEL